MVGFAVPSCGAYQDANGIATRTHVSKPFHEQGEITDDREDLLAHLAGLFRVERPRCLHGCLHLMLFGGNVSGSDLLRRDGDRDGVGCESSRLQHRGSFRLGGSEKAVMFERCGQPRQRRPLLVN